MSPRNSNPRLLSLACIVTAVWLAACSSPPKDDAAKVVQSDPTTGAELSSGEAISTRDEPPAAPVLSAPKRSSRKAKHVEKRHVPRHEPSEDDAPPAEAAEMAAAQNEVAIRCAVALPDDSSDHPELCRDFRVVVMEIGKGEVDRFRFDGSGQYRFRAQAGKTYELKPLVGKTWRVEIGPKPRFRAGDEVEAKFTQHL